MIDETNFVLMRFDGLNLMFPSSDVQAVESLSNLRRDESHVPAMGVLTLDDQELPVFALSKKFGFMNDPQQDRRFCICLETQDSSDRYALACDRVEQYTASDDMPVQELPEFMRMSGSPIRAMVRVDNGLGLVCTAESMRIFVETGESPDV